MCVCARVRVCAGYYDCTLSLAIEERPEDAGSSSVGESSKEGGASGKSGKLVRGGTCHLVKGGWSIADYLTYDW